MDIYNLFPGSFGSNCYLLISGNQAAVVDPSADAGVILQKIAEKGATLQYILLTHGHFDHMLFSQHWLDLGAKLYVHRLDAQALRSPSLNLSQVINQRLVLPEADVLLEEGDTVCEGGLELTVLHTPGHTPGGVCYQAGNVLFSGDTLFYRSYGRLDLPGGDASEMSHSLARLMQLHGETVAYPGHGMKTKIAWERGNYA